MPRYTFICKYAIGFDSDSEDEAFDMAYDSIPSDGWSVDATLVEGA